MGPLKCAALWGSGAMFAMAIHELMIHGKTDINIGVVLIVTVIAWIMP